MQTHYNNLKVSRDAPIEVIRAAFRSLAAKYHPDLNPGNDEAARIMRIVARSYAVISDPVSRAQHDRWIMGVESAAEGRESPSAQRQPLRRPTESSPARPPCFRLEEQGRTGSWIVGISIFFVAIMSGIAFIPRRSVTAPANSIQTPTPSPVTPTVQELRGRPFLSRKSTRQFCGMLRCRTRYIIAVPHSLPMASFGQPIRATFSVIPMKPGTLWLP